MSSQAHDAPFADVWEFAGQLEIAAAPETHEQVRAYILNSSSSKLSSLYFGDPNDRYNNALPT